MPNLCRKNPLLCVYKHEFFLRNRPFWRFLTPKMSQPIVWVHPFMAILMPTEPYPTRQMMVETPDCKYLQSRLQTFAMAVANVCVRAVICSKAAYK